MIYDPTKEYGTGGYFDGPVSGYETAVDALRQMLRLVAPEDWSRITMHASTAEGGNRAFIGFKINHQQTHG